MSSWDTTGLSTSFNPSRPTQNVSAITPSATTNYVVPYSKYNSQVSPLFPSDGQPIQPYQQPNYRSQAAEAFQPIQTNPINTR